MRFGLGFVISVGVQVLVLEDIDLRPQSGLKRGETGILTVLEPEHIFIRWHWPHWDWPSQWRNELYLTREDDDIITKLKFNPHQSVIDFYSRLPHVA